MRNGISAASVPYKLNLPYASQINAACIYNDWFPMLAYSIATVETISVEVSGWIASVYPGKNAATVITGDGSQDNPFGYGLFQETPAASGLSLPEAWEDPYTAAVFAIRNHLQPAEVFWAGTIGLQADDLKRAIAAEYNDGRSNALKGHQEGDVGKYTTPGPDGTLYPDRVLAACAALEAGRSPFA